MLEEGPHPRLARGRRQDRLYHRLDESLALALDGAELELFFRAEMRKQPALGHVELARQASDRHALETDRRGQGPRPIEDCVAAPATLAHAQ